jgi:release factor glutamine methyltransferase
MNIRENIKAICLTLKSISPTAELDATVLIGSVIHQPQVFVLTNPDFTLSVFEQETLNILVNKRKQHVPIAYLIGYKEFYRLKFLVNEDVLIPRPETELLVEQCLAIIQKSATKNPIIWDIGTGSGCIAITIAKNSPKTSIIATDISKPALNISQKNAKLHTVERQITFIQSDLLNFRDQNTPQPLVIIANLPYLDEDVYQDKSIQSEPKVALYSPNKGLLHYQKLLEQLHQNQNLPQNILLEINPEQTKPLKHLIHQLFDSCKINCIKDYSSQDRIMNIFLGKGGNCEK